MNKIAIGQDVLLIGISHPNEVSFTISRLVDGGTDEEDAIRFMQAEMFLDWDDASLDELLVVTSDLNCRQIDLRKYDQTPTCDICGKPEDQEMNGREYNWNGETGNHLTCEQFG